MSDIIRDIHIVWVGDDSLRPDPFIRSWSDMNPDWNVHLYGNNSMRRGHWRGAGHIREFARRNAWCGVADIMRWNILSRNGGFAIDADGPCVRPLEDWLFEGASFAASAESEEALPGVVANGYVYSVPGHPIVESVLEHIEGIPLINDLPPFQLTGPVPLTDAVSRHQGVARIWPSYHFIPNHRLAPAYSGEGPVFAMQYFMSTHGTYSSGYDGIGPYAGWPDPDLPA